MVKSHEGEVRLSFLSRALSRRKRNLQGAQAEVMFTNAIIENIPDMIFIKEAKELRFIRFNRAGEELLGYSREDLIGKSDTDFFPPEEARSFIEKDRRVFSEGKPLDIPEEPIHTRHRGVRILHTQKIPLYDRKGEPEYLLGISEDITEKKQAEDNRHRLLKEQLARNEAEQALSHRDEFISIAAHELRSPITALKLQLAFLAKNLPEMATEPAQRFLFLLQHSQDQLNRFAKLVGSLLDVTCARKGALVLEMTEENLSEKVLQVAKRQEIELTRAGCPLKLHLQPDVSGIWDPSRIEQVVENLLGNAVKYGAGKPIEISTSLQGAKARLTVRDEGIGIAKEDHTRIFERFERVATAKAFGGLGLGLFIVRQIVEAHGGSVWVESELGRGSLFCVELPIHHAAVMRQAI